MAVCKVVLKPIKQVSTNSKVDQLRQKLLRNQDKEYQFGLFGQAISQFHEKLAAAVTR
jgi:hypothetical protein